MFDTMNALHAAMNEEINDIREKNSERYSDVGEHFYEDGSVVVPVSEEERFESIGLDFVDLDENMTCDRFFRSSDYEGVINMDDIVKITGGLSMLASIAEMMTKSDHRGRFYGMMISYENKKLNPMHPVIAAMIVTKEIVLPEEFTIILYPYYSGAAGYSPMTSEQYQEELVDFIAKVRNEQYKPDVKYTPTQQYETDVKRFLSNPDYAVTFEEGGSRVEKALIPVHLATDSLMYPYYGMIESRLIDGEYRSINLFPMLSGSLETPVEEYDITCVGDLSSMNFNSLYVLSNLNLSSMYFDHIITEETPTFIDACQMLSARFIIAAENERKGKGDYRPREEDAEEPEEPEEADDRGTDGEESRRDMVAHLTKSFEQFSESGKAFNINVLIEENAVSVEEAAFMARELGIDPLEVDKLDYASSGNVNNIRKYLFYEKCGSVKELLDEIEFWKGTEYLKRMVQAFSRYTNRPEGDFDASPVADWYHVSKDLLEMLIEVFNKGE